MVSVIIPVFNRKQTILKAIRSVLNQSFKDFELIVVDDGSTDGTPEMIKKQFPDHVKLIIQKNQGVSSARNHGIRTAKGEWLAFLDSDDEWLPKKLEKQVAALIGSNSWVCHTDEIWIRNGVRVNPHKHHAKTGGDIFLKSLQLCAMSPSSIIIHRKIFDRIGLFDESLPVCEDYDLFLRITSRYPVLHLPENLIIKYGGHADQLSKAYFAMDRFRIRAIDKLLVEVTELKSEQKKAAQKMLLHKAQIVLNGAQKRHNEKQSSEMQNYLNRWKNEIG